MRRALSAKHAFVQIMQRPRGIDPNVSSKNEDTQDLLAVAMADAPRVEIQAVCADRVDLSSPCPSRRHAISYHMTLSLSVYIYI